MKNTIEYKGYFANIQFSHEDMVLHGKIEGIDDLITFESESALEIEKEFQNAVDDYLAFCEEIGKEPDKVYKGTFNVRIDPHLHRDISLLGLRTGRTLNQTVEDAIRQYVTPVTEYRTATADTLLSAVSTFADWFGSSSWQLTHMEPNNTYMTAVVSNEVCTAKGVTE